MTIITTLKTYPNMGAAFDACEALSTRFKAAHKRSEKVDLNIAMSGDPKKPLIEVRMHATSEHAADARWMEEAIKTL